MVESHIYFISFHFQVEVGSSMCITIGVKLRLFVAIWSFAYYYEYVE